MSKKCENCGKPNRSYIVSKRKHGMILQREKIRSLQLINGKHLCDYCAAKAQAPKCEECGEPSLFEDKLTPRPLLPYPRGAKPLMLCLYCHVDYQVSDYAPKSVIHSFSEHLERGD